MCGRLMVQMSHTQRCAVVSDVASFINAGSVIDVDVFYGSMINSLVATFLYASETNVISADFFSYKNNLG